VAFSAGGDGGGKPPEHLAQFAHVVFAESRNSLNKALLLAAASAGRQTG
jgi:hypothetical protein